jgi:hypothetical protein
VLENGTVDSDVLSFSTGMKVELVAGISFELKLTVLISPLNSAFIDGIIPIMGRPVLPVTIAG